jgi:nitrite reductase/ring-hydroxylating ferredoxin subunit
MTAPAEWRCPASAVPVGTTATFRLACGGREVAGFVVHHATGYAAYVNRCSHVGTPLDLWPNEFLSEDGSALVCATHGATYEPATGFCTGGPCAGDTLTPLPARVEGDSLVVSCAAA